MSRVRYLTLRCPSLDALVGGRARMTIDDVIERGRSVIRGAGVWADLAGLGLLPSAWAVLAFALGMPASVFVVLLGASLMLNLVLAGAAIRYRRRLRGAAKYNQRVLDLLGSPNP